MFSLTKAWSTLNYKNKRYLIFIFFLMFLSMLLETLGIGIILPLLAIFLDGNIENSFFSHFYFFGKPSKEQLIYIGLGLTLIVFLVKNIFLIFNHWQQCKFLRTMHLEFSDKLFKSYLKREYIFFLQTNTAKLIRNVTTEINSFVEYFNKYLILLSEILIFIGIAFLLFYVDFLLTVVLLFLVGLFAFIIHRFTRGKIDSYGKERIVLDGEINKHFIQGLSSAKDIKVLGREDDLIHQVYKNLLKGKKLNLFITFIYGLPKFLFEILIVGAFLVLVLIMVYAKRDSSDIIQYLGIFAVAAFRIIPAAARILTSLQNLKFRQPTIDLLSKELSYVPNLLKQKNDKPNKSNSPLSFQKQINLNNLSFSYPKRKEFFLSDISITINKGDFIGIVGETGSGKSTLINLFIGLLKPSKGEIEVDEKNIFLNLTRWQKKIGYVPQLIYLIDDSIRKNIAFGLREEDIDDNLVNKALEKARLAEFVKNLPNGLDTIVGEKGMNLSGGQQQRLGIARSLYHDPEILILDEATSSLDYLTEKKIMESVQFLKRKKTLIIVTHRLSTVEKCDKVFTLQKGKIIKQGTPKEVLANE